MDRCQSNLKKTGQITKICEHNNFDIKKANFARYIGLRVSVCEQKGLKENPLYLAKHFLFLYNLKHKLFNLKSNN
ncbi:hypothetical protein BpHYR1_011913 [Brachionus plicatilis]|uniref:Uncharacterized protein n=1 Tax=Brachionus plicatilis TaxID=10195 RepID=A0A3M7RH22_BRAPC|nr:hypothetical protein BpHYR1_011913 [Brachionus plicatilis]